MHPRRLAPALVGGNTKRSATAVAAPRALSQRRSDVPTRSAHTFGSHLLPFSWALDRFVDLQEGTPHMLVTHPDAPPATALFVDLSRRCQPSIDLAVELIRTAAARREGGMIQLAEAVLACVSLASNPGVCDALCLALLQCGLYTKASSIIAQLKDSEVGAETWAAFMEAMSSKRLCNSALLFRLVQGDAFPNCRLTLAQTCSLLTAGSTGHLSPIVALHILRRFTQPNGATPAPGLHPLPFLIFFNIVVNSRLPHAATYTLHWRISWTLFQMLNKSNPMWHKDHPSLAEPLVKQVLSIAAKGANPFLGLNLIRLIVAAEISDAIHVSLHFLHRLTIHHHKGDATTVAKKIVCWLLETVCIHLKPGFEQHVLPLVRILIALNLHAEVSQLYNGVIENAHNTTEQLREDLVRQLADLVCPSCSSILLDKNVYAQRCCHVCLTIVPPKEQTLLPSFRLSAAEKVAAVERRKQRRIAQFSDLREMTKSKDVRNPQLFSTKTVSDDMPLPFALPPSKSRVLVSSAASRDAAQVFQERIMGEPLVSAIPVRTTTGVKIIALPTNQLDMSDIRASLELENKRKQVTERAASRAAELKDRSFQYESKHALPSTARSATSKLEPARPMLYVPWKCVWCQEENAATSDRTNCSACGATTGPEGSWRRFAFSVNNDVMTEIRMRIARAEEQPAHAVVAAYYLMVYRPAFLMRATPHDFALVEKLVQLLTDAGERVLAAHMYIRLLPPALRTVNVTVVGLAKLFGVDNVDERLSMEDMQDEKVFFPKLFGEHTCRACYGKHPWELCPLVTRNFPGSKMSLQVSAEEKIKIGLDRVKVAVLAAAATPTPDSIFEAYRVFMQVAGGRELFATHYPAETNRLSLLLSSTGNFRRAAFVLCHLPFGQRETKAYLAFSSYFGVANEDATGTLNRHLSPKNSAMCSASFMQVTATCCICLDESHASFACPRLDEWFKAVMSAGDRGEANKLHAWRVQLEGWLMSGPERLQALYRFLLSHVDELDKLKAISFAAAPSSSCVPDGLSASDAVILAENNAQSVVTYGLNACIRKLAHTGCRGNAVRLYARSPPSIVSFDTVIAMLKLNNVDADLIETFAEAYHNVGIIDPSWSVFGMPANVCLVCFEAGHTFHACPEVIALHHMHKVTFYTNHLGGIRVDNRGVLAAAHYLYYLIQSLQLTSQMIGSNPALARTLLRVVRRCYTSGLTAQGYRIMRRIPSQMIPDSVFEAFWLSSGLPVNYVAEQSSKLRALYSQYGLVRTEKNVAVLEEGEEAELINAAVAGASSATDNVRMSRAEFTRNYYLILEASLCKHCNRTGHDFSECKLFMNEVDFSRDLISTFRTAIACEHIEATEAVSILMQIARFLVAYHQHVPFYATGVHRCYNAMVALMAMVNQPAVALRLMLCTPACFRTRHAHFHLLHALGMGRPEANMRMEHFLVTGDMGDQNVALATYRSPIADLLMSELVGHIPGVHQLLASADAVILSACAVDEHARAPPPEATIALEQSCNIDQLRESWQPLQSRVEVLAGQRLGSRHEIFLEDVSFDGEVPTMAGAVSPIPDPRDEGAPRQVVAEATIIEAFGSAAGGASQRPTK